MLAEPLSLQRMVIQNSELGLGSLYLPLLDAFLASIIDLLPSPKYTVIYTTTPVSANQHPLVSESRVYEMDETFPSSVHMDLKRDFSIHELASSGNTTLSSGPLFEKYQFFTPGEFQIPHDNLDLIADDFLRYLYGSSCGVDPPLYSLHCNFWRCKFAGFVRCV